MMATVRGGAVGVRDVRASVRSVVPRRAMCGVRRGAGVVARASDAGDDERRSWATEAKRVAATALAAAVMATGT